MSDLSPSSPRSDTESFDSLSVAPLTHLDIDKVSETPVWPLNWKELFLIFPTLIKSGLPIAVTSIAGYLLPALNIMFVGTYGTPEEFAAISLGNTYSNVFSIAVFSSINQGFGVLASQFFGARKYKEVGLLYKRNLCVLGIVAIFSIIIMFFADHLLIALDFEPNISMNVGVYLRYLIPSIIAYNIYDCTRFYLTSQELFFFQGAVQFGIAIIHIFWSWLFIAHLGLSIRGAAIAKSISDISAATILVVYVCFNKKAKRCSVPWKKKVLREWRKHLKDTLKIGGNTYLSWISLEVSVFIVGILDDPAIIGAQGATFNLSNTFFSLNLGNSIAMQTYIGNSVGERHKYKAQKFMVAGLLLNALYSLINIILMVSLRKTLANLYSIDERTLEIFSNMWTVYCIGHIFDSTSNHVMGIIRTVGKEMQALLYCFIPYVVLGLPCQWLLAIELDYGYIMVWICIIVEMALMAILAGRETILLDWNQIIQLIKNKIHNQMEIDEKSRLLDPEFHED